MVFVSYTSIKSFNSERLQIAVIQRGAELFYSTVVGLDEECL